MSYYDVMYIFKDVNGYPYWAVQDIPAVFTQDINYVLKGRDRYRVAVKEVDMFEAFRKGTELLIVSLKEDGKLK